MARDLDLCRAGEPSIAWPKGSNVKELVEESFSLDQPLVDIGYRICHQIASSDPILSRIEFRTRFFALESKISRSQERTNPLTTFQLVYDCRSGFGIATYKHSSIWHVPAARGGEDLLNGVGVNKRNRPVTIKTVYEYPRTPTESIVPVTTLAPYTREEAFDPRVLSVHRKLYEATKSDFYYSASGNPLSTDALMDVAFYIAEQDQSSGKLEQVSLSLSLPNSAATLAGIRTRSEYESSKKPKMSVIRKVGACPKVYIALGSNMGDRCNWIEKACKEMDKGGIKVIRTSALYETEAMYLKEQDSFLNGVCEVSISVISYPGVIHDHSLRFETET